MFDSTQAPVDRLALEDQITREWVADFKFPEINCTGRGPIVTKLQATKTSEKFWTNFYPLANAVAKGSSQVIFI